MTNRILIANRGEIALRILRACRILGKETVAIHTDIDRHLPHLKMADDQVRVSHYLNAEDVLMAATTRGCDAVHPGYGLLAENGLFARQVEAAGLTFVGPSPDHIDDLGDKVAARQLFSSMGLTPIPGSEGAVASAAEARDIADKIGYPLVVKAAFGGGGRGIRAVHDADELEEVLALSRGEAALSFGRDEVFIEKMLVGARHVEVQILGDGAGNCVHLGTRDCSVQRRYQKLVEEAPAPDIPAEPLLNLVQRSIEVMSELRYRNAGTLEFLFCYGEFFFLEVNTRLQVEHPVSEFVSGQDIVAAQIAIADDGVLPFQQSQVSLSGSSIECRILAESSDGKPSPGLITNLRLPGGPGVRIDSHAYVGYEVPHQYDSLLAKLIVYGQNRSEALAKMRFALTEMKIDGIQTNIELLLRIISDPDFSQVRFDTSWKPQ